MLFSGVLSVKSAPKGLVDYATTADGPADGSQQSGSTPPPTPAATENATIVSMQQAPLEAQAALAAQEKQLLPSP